MFQQLPESYMHLRSCLPTVAKRVHGEEATDPDSHSDLMRGSVVQLWACIRQMHNLPVETDAADRRPAP